MLCFKCPAASAERQRFIKSSAFFEKRGKATDLRQQARIFGSGIGLLESKRTLQLNFSL